MKLADELNKAGLSPEAVSWDNGEAKLVNAFDKRFKKLIGH